MKKMITALLFCVITFPAVAQFDSSYIERNWPAIASDTNKTYQEIVGICDSMFALVGYSDSAAIDTTEIEETDGSPYVLYRRWRNFWASRCDVETGKLHDFMADAIAVLNNQNKSTTYVPGNCGWPTLVFSFFPLNHPTLGNRTSAYFGVKLSLRNRLRKDVKPDVLRFAKDLRDKRYSSAEYSQYFVTAN